MRDYEWVSVAISRQIAERLPEVTLNDLQAAWLMLMKRARMTQHHKVRREELSVREHMANILRRLQGGMYVEFQDLLETGGGVAKLVVSFLAMLELAREKLVDITQREAFAPIHVKLAEATIHESA